MAPPRFGAVKAAKMLRILDGLGYVTVRQKGSHRRLKAPGRPSLTFSHFGGDELPPGLVRTILVKEVGLTIEEALEVVR